MTASAQLLSGPSDTGVDAFTLGPYTFDPYTTPLLLPQEGWATFPAPVFPGPPVFNIAGGNLDGIGLAPQNFEVFNASGQEVGTIGTAGTILQVLGQDSYEFTVTSSTPVLLGSTANLPAVGTVYDIFKGLGVGPGGSNAFENVYEATPSGNIADYLVEPSGQYNLADPIRLPLGLGTINLSSLLTTNYAADLQPGAAFSSLATAADASIGPDAFTINVPGFDYTLDPVSTLLAPDTYNAVTPLAGFPPFFAAGGADFIGISVDTQGFNVYNAAGTDVGSIQADEFVVNAVGVTSTEEVVTAALPQLGFTDANLPAVGTVFSVTNLAPFHNAGKAEVYLTTPTTSATDTTVTTTGSFTEAAPFNLDSAGTAEINPASVFASLAAEQPQDASIPPPLLGAPATDAFTINQITFYPETSLLTEGYNNIAQTLGAAPWVAAFGGSAEGISLAPQDFFYYSGTGASAHLEGELTTSMSVLDVLSFSNASFTVTGCAIVLCTDAPANGTIFDVFNLGGGIENIYEGTPSGTVTDTLMTAFGPLITFTIPSLDAAIPLNPLDIIPAGFDVPAL
ncbi:hypothetical protein [Mycobacterium cookii]|uniref:hypothetical protein n=1 Tax=Mycobacterium cookii TaxID=1775 RepID=UPI0013D57FDE|nr:hypothetical protein [Mycobacterium cookii]MCV7329764.1 hypothetical protein [Mycobacterium cookii]